MADDDFLDEMIGERTQADPAFPQLLDAAIARRKLEADRATAFGLDDGRTDPQ